MAWKMTRDPSTQVIQVTYYDQITPTDLKEAVAARIALQKETGYTHILIDLSDSEFMASTIDLFNIPAKLYQQGGISTQSVLALVLPNSDSSRDKDAAMFYVTACQNRGWCVQAFSDMPSAMAWLLASVPHTTDSQS